MREFSLNIWKDDEYRDEAAYGFVPNIHAYIHDNNDENSNGNVSGNRDCMLIVPGGGYCMCTPHEGELPARVFYEQGMNVFVLTYTTDITMSVPLKKQPLMDVSRAVRFIRKNAEEYNIKDSRFIICGFSAGAHVCGSLAVHYDDVEDMDPDYRDISNRPDGVILSYPVITSGEYTHIYTIQTLLGNEPSREELEYYSIEKNVTENTPPCFIWQTLTDDLVPVENSYLMAEALRSKGVPYAHYVFPSGFHGLSVPSDEFFNGYTGGQYTLDQLERAVKAVKQGQGINVSDRRKAELEAQFPDIIPDEESQTETVDEDNFSESLKNDKNTSDKESDKDADSENKEEFIPIIDRTWSEDVGLWTELARVWINRIGI